MILVLDDDPIIGKCLMRILKKNKLEGRLYNNVIDAITGVNEGKLEMIIMDVLLTGPDGFTLLNELASYKDTMDVPVVIISEKDFLKYDLSQYNVVGCLNKATMTPADVEEILQKCELTGVR